MTLDSEVRDAVENARRLLQNHGYDCRTTADDLVLWFEADTPYDQGFGLKEAIAIPLIVVHELVEVENVKKMGLRLTKDVIINNLGKVDDSHLKATEIELDIAESTGNVEHIRDRLKDISAWIKDQSVTPENKARYRKLRERYVRTVKRLSKKKSGFRR